MEQALDTEAQQIVIDLLTGRIRLGIIALAERKEELEAQEYTKEIGNILTIIELRLDLLIKVELYLLEPTKEHYAFISRGHQIIQPGDLKMMLEETERTFIKKVLQGL